MFGALVEVIIINDDMVTYLEEVPTDVLPYLEKSTGHLANRFIVVNLQYGPGFSGPGNDVFSEERATGEPADAHNSNFLHPVLYYYDKPITCKMLLLTKLVYLPACLSVHSSLCVHLFVFWLITLESSVTLQPCHHSSCLVLQRYTTWLKTSSHSGQLLYHICCHLEDS
jgi:hypothetical protein